MVMFFVSCEKTDDTPGTDPRSQYIGTWTCQESPSINYPVTITIDSSNSTQIFMNNFHYFGANEKAYAIATTNNLTIPTQVILSHTVYGSGTLVNSKKITIKYYVNNQTDVDTINAAYTK